MIDSSYYREYDYLKGITYADVCSVGLQPRRTLSLCERFQREFINSFGRICLTEYANIRRKTAEQFAMMIGANADDVLFETNTTQGFQKLTSALPIEKGEKVLLIQDDYPSVGMHFYAKGIPVITIPMRNGRVDEDELIDLLHREPVRIICLSYVQSYSGYKLDLKKIGSVCQKLGIFLCVDGIQGLGRNQLNVADCGISILSCGGFKGLLGVLGTSVHYVHPSLWRNLQPFSFDDENTFVDLSLSKTQIAVSNAAQLDIGSQNTYGIAALGESIQMLNEISIPEIEKKIQMIETLYRQKLTDLPLNWIGDTDGNHRSGNVVFLYNPIYYNALLKQLEKEKIILHLHPDRLRVGFHYYNTAEDVEKLSAAIHHIFHP